MTITSSLPTVEIDLTGSWPDDVVDLTDRRRLLLHAVFGVDVPRTLVDRVFEAPEPAAQSSAASAAPSASSGSTTIRSDGRSSSTVAR